MKRSLLAAVCGSLFMLHSNYAQTAPPPSPITFPKTPAQHWTLDNGLTLIVLEDHSAPVASVQAWVATGSVDEDEQLGAGLSHILEHMLFKGTETRTTNEIARKIQDEGGYINAYTSFDRTVYWIDVPSKGASAAIDILADSMMNSTLPPEEYIKEQDVIRSEFRMGYDNPDRMSSLKMFATAFSTHPYRLPVIGEMPIYNRLTRDDVMAYYKERYVPNNMFFVVVGDVDAGEVRKQVEAIFEKYPQRALKPVYVPAEPPQLGRREAHSEFKTELTRLDIAWHIPAITHPDVPALDLLSTILGSGRSSRLYRTIREEKGLAHSVSAYSFSPKDPGLFGVDATLDPDKREEATAAIQAMIEDVKNNGVSEAEIAKAKRLSLSQQIGTLVTMRGKASDLGSNWLTTRNLDFSRDYLEAVQKVTRDDIQRVARTYLVPQSETITSLNPPGSLTTKDAVAEAPAAGEIQKFTLSNGVRLLVREDPRLPLVDIVATFKAGLLAETPETNGLTRLYAQTILKGTESRTGEQIADAIEEAGGSIRSDAGNNSFSVSVDVMKPDLKLGLELLSDVILHPAFPEKAVAREKEIQIAGIKSEEEQMTTVARNIMREALFPKHPYGLRANGSVESVAALTRENLTNFRGDYVAGENMVIAVFGDVKAEEVKAMVEKQFAEMEAGKAVLEELPQPVARVEEQDVEAFRDKSQAVLMVGYLGSDMFDEDQYALQLIDEASSDLGSRFFIRIREDLGMAYFVGSSQTAGLVRGPFVFYVGTSPKDLPKVKAELMDEIGKLAGDGLTKEELARAKEKLIGSLAIRNQSNGAYASSAATYELYGLGYDYEDKMKSKIEALTLEQVKAVAQKYFKDKPPVVAVVRSKPAAEASAKEEAPGEAVAPEKE